MASKAEQAYMSSSSPAKATPTTTGRTIPLQVICPGMSRSGTGSLRSALETLGIGRTFHGLRLGERPQDLDIWIDLVNRKYPPSGRAGDTKPITTADFDRILGDCGAVTDMPCAAFWRELLAAYPSAKVILVERELEAWYASFYSAVVAGMMSFKGRVLANPWVAWWIGYRNPEMLHKLFLAYFQARNREQLAANARRVYVEHNEAVRKVCREQGRPLLEYELGSGWAPICEFLGVNVPVGVEFPRSNEAKVLLPFIHKAQSQLLVTAAKKLLSRSAVVAVVVGAVAVAWNKPDFRGWIGKSIH